MEPIDNIKQYKLYVDAIPMSGTPGSWKFVYKDGTQNHGVPEFDFYLPFFLKKTYEIYEYVDVDKEDKIGKIQRQEINPFFIEFGFFDDIQRNRVNRGVDLTSAMLNFIRLRRPDVASLNTNELRKWYDDIGINEFPWNEGTPQETTPDDIDEVNFVSGHIVSKAEFFNIDINK